MQRRKSFVIHPRAEDEDEWEVLSRVVVVDRAMANERREWNQTKSPHYMLRSRGAQEYWGSAPPEITQAQEMASESLLSQ